MTLEEFLALASRTAQGLADAQERRRLLAAAQTASAGADQQYTQDRAALAAALDQLYPPTPGDGAAPVQASAPMAAGWPSLPSLPSLPSAGRLAELLARVQSLLAQVQSHLPPAP